MYPSLYHFVVQTFGIEIVLLKFVNTFGFFVALAFLAASYLQAKEFGRKHIEGKIPSQEKTIIKGKDLNVVNLVLNTLFGFIIGYKLLYLILNRDIATTDPPAFILSAQGSLIGGIILGAVFAFFQVRDYRKEKATFPEKKSVVTKILPQQLSGNITIVAAIFGILGAKLFHLLEYPDEFTKFFSSFDAQNFLSGLTIYGGLIVGGAAVLFYMFRNGINPLHGADANAPGLFLSYGIGRLGCHFSGDGDWGEVNTAAKPLSWLPDWLWSYAYPNNVLGENKLLTEDQGYFIHQDYGMYLDPGVYPTPVYEAIFSILVFILLWKYRKKFTIPGTLFMVYLMINGFERFWIEKIRVNEPQDFFGIEATQAEIISVVLFILGLVGYIYLKRRNKTNSSLA